MFAFSRQEKGLLFFLATVLSAGGIADYCLRSIPTCAQRIAFLEKISQPKTADLNTVTFAELAALPHVGRSLAERIVRYRQERGRFKNIDELRNIPGVGKKFFTQISGLLVVLPEDNDD